MESAVNPLFETIQRILADGTIGQSYCGHHWIRKKQFGGSSLLSAGCHAVDGLRWFLRATRDPALAGAKGLGEYSDHSPG